MRSPMTITVTVKTPAELVAALTALEQAKVKVAA